MTTTNPAQPKSHEEHVKTLTETLALRIRPMSVRERTAFIDGLLLVLNIADNIAPLSIDPLSSDYEMERFKEVAAMTLGLIAEAVEPIIQRYSEPGR